MALNLVKKTIEVESFIGAEDAQALLRAECAVSGGGRDSVNILLADAYLALGEAEIQKNRVSVDGVAYAQAAYRLGEEASVRAAACQANMSHIFEIEGAKPGMIARVQARVEHVEAQYENGHMVFSITVRLMARITQLAPVEAITEMSGVEGLEVKYEELESLKLAAEARASALAAENVTLPAALDARCALMDWFTVSVESVSRDLGGAKITGKIMTEALIASGVAGRPVALVKYPMPFEIMAELPEWLGEDISAEVNVKRLVSQVDEGGQSDSQLRLEADIEARVYAMARENARVAEDAYSVSRPDVSVETREITVPTGAVAISCAENFKGTLLLPPDAPGAGAVLATRAVPVLSGVAVADGKTVFEGVLETTALYMPAGSDKLGSASADLPFEIKCEGELGEDAWVNISVTNAESAALLSDRLETRATVMISGSRTITRDYEIAVNATQTEGDVEKKSGIVIYWPDSADDAWSVGKRYRLAQSATEEIAGGAVVSGKPFIARL